MDNHYSKITLHNRVSNGDGRDNTLVSKDETILYSPYQYRTLIINSRERNRTSWDNAYSFQILLDEPIRFVRSIKLLDFICHLERRYLVHEYNNTFTITYSGTSATVTIPEGDYDLTLYGGTPTTLASTVASQIQDVLQNKIGGTAAAATVTASVSAVTDKITLKYNNNDVSDETLTINFSTSVSNKDTLAYVLGFKENTDYTVADGDGEVTADFRLNYTKSSVAVISINHNDFNVVKSNLSNKTNDTYGIVNIDKDYNKYKAGTPITKFFYNQLNYLDRLRIDINDIYGNPFDFQDSDLIMTFLIEYENQRN